MLEININNLKIEAEAGAHGRICYVLYPLDCLGDWIKSAAKRFGVSVAVVTGMDWDNDLTPWPAPGEPPGSPDFKGNARHFLTTLIEDVVPAVERQLGVKAGAERTLAGVSLSGLFTLWQWMDCEAFRNIISLSGSFWYAGMVEWIERHPAPHKNGKAYFLLGDREAASQVEAFRCVQTATESIVTRLHSEGIEDFFELVPGNHYQHGVERLNRAFSWMFL